MQDSDLDKQMERRWPEALFRIGQRRWRLLRESFSPERKRFMGGLLCAWWLVAFVATACSPQGPVPSDTVASAVALESPSCRDCHQEIYSAWAATDHAHANRSLNRERDYAAFAEHPLISDGGTQFALSWREREPEMVELRLGVETTRHTPSFIIGAKPLWQPLVPAEGGRWQPTDMAFDPNRQEWFNVFGQENRRPGEWGHWTGRGMNWNSMCAQCHMTGYRKNYDAPTDSYRSTWVEQGVGCIQCHGPMPPDHKYLPKNIAGARAPTSKKPFFGDRVRMMDVCASCHARHEPLTDRFQPGDDYFDHFRLTLPISPVFYADGQQRDENFNWTSMLLSRMGGHGGVTCFDCHDPHSNKTILPVENNQLCLQCHSASGRTSPNGVRAPAIDPLAHSHHQPGSAGNSCVACHMPTTNYMQRAPRHDHGWLIPDPLLNKELGIPDACSKCHTGQPVEWSIAAAEKWYGDRMETRQRRRARAIAAVQSDSPGGLAAALALWPEEDLPIWRATLLEVVARHAGDPKVFDLAKAALGDPHPAVRASAVRTLGRSAGATSSLSPLLNDPSRVVRIEAAWALSAQLGENSPARRELDEYLGLWLDQPGGRLQRGQDFAHRGMLSEAAAEMSTAAAWDPHSPGIRQSLGLVLAQLGQIDPAAANLARAADLLSDDAAAAFDAGLALAEAGRAKDAERYLRAAVDRDPGFHRAWYNLGLILAEEERLGDAAEALRRAEQLAPGVKDYPAALAGVFQRLGDSAGARAAAERAAGIPSTSSPQQRLLRQK